MHPTLASWPGLVDADPTIVGALVVAIAGFAAGHLARRLWPARRRAPDRRAAGGAV